MGEIGTDRFPHSSLKAHFIFTIHGLAVGVKIKFPHSRLRLSWGNFIFTPPAAPFMVKTKCAFRDSWGNLFFPFRGFATQGEKSRPYFSTLRDWHIPFKLLTKCTYLCNNQSLTIIDKRSTRFKLSQKKFYRCNNKKRN